MNVLSWFTDNKHEKEKKKLREELAQSIMKFERRRGEVEQVAEDVMKMMHRRSNGIEKN